MYIVLSLSTVPKVHFVHPSVAPTPVVYGQIMRHTYGVIIPLSLQVQVQVQKVKSSKFKFKVKFKFFKKKKIFF